MRLEPLVPRPCFDSCLLQWFEEQITSLKPELEDIAQAALSLEDDEDLLEQQSTLEKTCMTYSLESQVPTVWSEK